MCVDCESPARGSPARAARWALSVLAALTVSAAGASDLNGRGEVTWAQDDATGSTSEYLRQSYSADFRRQVSYPISYRLSLRYQEDAGTVRAGGSDYDLRLRTLTPSAGLDWRTDAFGLTAAYRLNDEDRVDATAGASSSRTIERITLGLSARPFERGDATLGLDRLAYSSATTSTVDDRLGVTFRYTSPSLRVSSEGRVLRYEDALRGATRLSMGPRVTAAWSRAFGESAQVSTQYVLDAYRTEQTAQGSLPVSIPVELEPLSGLQLVDNLPDDTPLMPAEPRLVDRSLDVSAGISLGPLGASFNNLGLDLGRVTALDELRIHVRSSVGAPVPFGGGVTWSVYSSLDGLHWIPVNANPAAFDTTLSAYVVTFASTSAQYFKAVNFGVNTVETLVTELQGFIHETFRPDETRVSSSVRQGLNLTATARPWSKAQVGYSGQLNANALSPYGGAARWSTDAVNTVTAAVGPYAGLLYDAKVAQTTVRQPGGYSQDSTASNWAVQYRPIDRYQARLDARFALDEIRMSSAMEPVRTVTLGASAGNEARLLPTLDVSASAGLTRQRIVAGGTTDYLTAIGHARGPVLRDLELGLSATAQRILSRRGDTSAQTSVPLLRILTYQLYVADAQYRPSPQLTLHGRVGYADAGSSAGVVQSYRATWSPFPGGSVQLAFDYSEEIDPLSGQSFRRASATPRWDLNAHATLQLSYNMAKGTGALPVKQQNLFVTFSLRL